MFHSYVTLLGGTMLNIPGSLPRSVLPGAPDDPRATWLTALEGRWSSAERRTDLKCAGPENPVGPMVSEQFAIEYHYLSLIYLVKIVISHSYVSLPEAILLVS